MRREKFVCAAIAALLLTTLPADGRSSTSAEAGSVAGRSPTRFVLAISVDGLNPSALHRLGRRGTPRLHRMIAMGSATLNARTEVERTVTLPNHTGMLTGRRVNRDRGGHGVYFNRDSRQTVHRAAGHPVGSVFNVVHRHGRRTALFTSKGKFAMFHRSWPGSIDRFVLEEDNRRLVAAVRRDLRHPRAFTFVHLSLPDVIGHTHGFMSPAYLRAVRSTDRRIGELMATVRGSALLRRHLTLVLTADHGGLGHGHYRRDRLANYRVPFLAWGAGVATGRNLYALNPSFRDPGRRQPSYAAARQPIRNGTIADLATSLLGYEAVRGSELDADQALRLR